MRAASAVAMARDWSGLPHQTTPEKPSSVPALGREFRGHLDGAAAMASHDVGLFARCRLARTHAQEGRAGIVAETVRLAGRAGQVFFVIGPRAGAEPSERGPHLVGIGRAAGGVPVLRAASRGAAKRDR